tara:strand:- start:238 stop:522 length:285 start_codon:yes stop_codon:yes gene_type:complete
MDWLKAAVGIGLQLFTGGSKAASAQQRFGPDSFLITEEQMAKESDDAKVALQQTAAMGETARYRDTENFYRNVLADYNIKDEAAFETLLEKLKA